MKWRGLSAHSDFSPWILTAYLLLLLIIFLTDAHAETYYKLPSSNHDVLSHLNNGFDTTGTSISQLPPVGSSSLTFVFDRTGSMNDDLNQVRQGAKGIFETVMKQRKRFIYNYVLVLFHDPDVDPPFISTDPEVFQQELASVSVQGGGDCPEMTLSGIKKALEVSLPGSYIYVFTDARSKDFHLEERVLNLIQEKQSSVVFVMTGDCGNRTAPGYQVFEKIAAASFGQVFHLEKAHVNTVLEYVRHSVAQRKVHILYEAREMGGRTHITHIPVDAHFSELTISVSGERNDHGDSIDIVLIDPQNRTVDKDTYAHTNGGIDLHTVKLIRIQDPQPGVWTIRVNSRLKHTIRVYGHGVIDFKYGFASRPIHTVNLAFPRPIAGQSAYLLVNMTGLIPPGIVVQLSLVDYYGRELFRSETQIHPKNPNLYFVGPFMPPKGFFFVRVNGEDEMNYEFMRIAPTAIASVEMTGPRAYMADRITATAYQSVNLSCSVESATPFMVYWLFGSSIIGGPLFYEETDTSTWTIDAVTPANRGHYTCHVTSSAGNDSAVTFLDSKEPPPHITATRNESVLLHNTAYLHCRTQSIERAQIRWIRNGIYIGNSAKTYMFENGTLRILDSTNNDEGPYICRVTTSGGHTEATIYLSINERPTARIIPKEQYVAIGGSFNLSCYITGTPIPNIEWLFNGIKIESNERFYTSHNSLQIFGHKIELADIGVYECRARNLVASSSDYATIRLAVAPKTHVSPDQHMIGRGSAVVVDCRIIAGIPTPIIKWHKDGREINSEKNILIHGGRLTIRKAGETDGGTYICRAENIAGVDIKPISIIIGSAPTIVNGSEKAFVDIGRSLSIPCRALGIPKPFVEWRKNNELKAIHSNDHVTILPDDTLLIQNVAIEDEGRYICAANNNFGRREKYTDVVITGLVSPILAHMPAEMHLIEGRQLRINCLVLMGNPKPKLSWFKNGQLFHNSNSSWIEEDGSLFIETGSEEHAAHYSCAAISPAGNATTSVRLNFIKRPAIQNAQGLPVTNVEEQMVARAGAPIDIVCRVIIPKNHSPLKIVWSIDGRPIATSNEYEIFENATLRIRQVNREHNGRYACTAINMAGEAEQGVRISVLSPPTIITAPQSSLNLIKGDAVTFPCVAEGDPPPDIRWQFNGVDFEDGVVDENSALILDDVNESHRGDFKCIAENELGDDERIVTLTVHTAPIVEGSGTIKTLIANVGEQVKLPCPAVAFPPPQRIWNYEKTKITPSMSDNTIVIEENGTLLIKTVNLHHAGLYECRVSNLAGEDSITYSLKVYLAPSIITDISNVHYGVLGGILDIPCRAVGAPNPQITWETDSGLQIPILVSQFIDNRKEENVYIDASGTLHFKNLRIIDAGAYKCVAINPAGIAYANTDVVVQVPPYLSEQQINEYSFVHGSSANLDCFMLGNPMPKISWIRFGEFLVSGKLRYQIFQNGTLHIDNVSEDDAGFYTCQGVNAAGKETAVVRVIIISRPEMRDSELQDFTYVELSGSTALHCPIISLPTPNIKWYFDEQPITLTDNQITISEDRRRLFITNIRENSAGIYKCIAENAAGNASKTFQVNVLVAPYIDETLFSRVLKVVENGHIDFTCPISGTPSPAITWLRNARQLYSNDLPDLKLSANGSIISINNAQLFHNGSYVCVGSNDAGNIDVRVDLLVLAAPKLSPNESIEANVEKSLKLNCIVSNADNKTTFTWLFNGSNILPKRIKSPNLSNEHELFIENVDNSMHGIYECVVRNSIGEARKRFSVNVLEPPRIFEELLEDKAMLNETVIGSKKNILRVKVGDLRQLKCPILTGNPPPQISWFINGEPIKMEKNDQRYIIDKIEHTLLDNGKILAIHGSESTSKRYICVLENKVGKASKEFHVQMIAPPRMEHSFEPGTASVIEIFEGNSVTFECPISAEAFPNDVNIIWLQDGVPIDENDNRYTISLDRIRLVIINVQRYDKHSFSCIAENDAGVAQAYFSLKVVVPPKIRGALLEEVVLVEGDEMDLRCDAEGSPIPTFKWFKDRNQLTSSSKQKFLNNNIMLYVEEVNIEDAGVYVCEASNSAGKTKKTFEITVITRPNIVDANKISHLETLPLHPINFDCPIVINSTYATVIAASEVEVIWFSPNNIQLNDGDMGIQLLNDGRRLTLLRPTVDNAGAYTCVARNRAGETKKIFQLELLSAPNIISKSEQFSVIENNSLIIPCEAYGRPIPTISWMKNGEPLSNDNSFELISSGQQLKITRASVEHAGTYTCEAVNRVARAIVNFDVKIITRPVIVNDGSFSRLREAIENESVSLICPIEKNTSGGEILWFKNGKQEPFKILHYRSILDNTNLQFEKITKADEGLYTCIASNDAGESRVDLELRVFTRPIILMLERDKNRITIENDTLTINCPSIGEPEPNVAWFLDGKAIAFWKFPNIVHHGSSLTFYNVSVNNAGRYTCEARNRAGLTEQDVHIEVYVPPHIQRNDLNNEISGKLGSRISIACPSTGIPQPQITWLKGGHPLDNISGIYFSAGNQKLHIANFTKELVDKYTCAARNAAGEDMFDFEVYLLEEPQIIEENISTEIQLNVGQTATLTCQVTGSPEPRISWLHDGTRFDVNPVQHRLLNNNRQLEIIAATEKDSGRYTCIATNNVGVADLDFFIHVVEMPSIDGEEVETRTVILNKAIELFCNAHGTQPLEIAWYKNGKPLSEFSNHEFIQLSDRGRNLHLLSAQRSDAVRWTCIIKNSAGEAQKHIDLKVHVAPTINETASSLALIKIIPEDQFRLDCIVDAIPPANIIWLKDGKKINDVNGELQFTNQAQTLWVRSANVERDNGRYECYAENLIGNASKNFLVKIIDPPLINGEPFEVLNLHVGEDRILSCLQINYAAENVTVTWLLDDRIISQGKSRASVSSSVTLTNGNVVINKARLRDSGQYTCVLSNEAGDVRKTFSVNVIESPHFMDTTNTHYSVIEGRSLVLDCSVMGTPKPQVTWTKNGKPIDDNKNSDNSDVVFINDHQQLHIEVVEARHSGHYSCVAENMPGRVEKDIIVSLLQPPKILTPEKKYEVRENETLTLSCTTEADIRNTQSNAAINFTWNKNGSPLQLSSNIQLSSDHRILHIMHAKHIDAATYTCQVSNEAGTAEANFDVLVLMPPYIQAVTPRKIDTILNGSVELNCYSEGVPQPEIEWFYDGKHKLFPGPQPQGGYIEINNATTLHIMGIRLTQEGRYTCISSNKVGRAEADTFVKITEIPHIDIVSKELRAIDGMEQRLECLVSGIPTPNIKWRRNGEPIDITRWSQFAAIFSTNASFSDKLNVIKHTIYNRNISVLDSGRYTCLATNHAGETRENIQLSVLVPPKIFESERILRVTEGGQFTLNCDAKALPLPEIRWRKDNTILNTTNSHFILSNISRADGGRYTCEVINEAGSASADFVVDVLIRPRLKDYSGGELHVVEGDRASLQCHSEGNPEPKIEWLRAGRPIADMSNFILSPRGDTLVILKAKRSDAGTYSCTVKNVVGEIDAPFMLIVLIPPYIDQTIDQNPRVIVNNSVVFDCPVMGYPQPKVSWLRNMIPIDFSDNLVVDGSNNLQIINVTTANAGRYTCKATNDVGELNTDYELEVLAPPKFGAEGQRIYEVVEGNSITMVCPVEAIPLPKIEWIREEKFVETNEHLRITSDSKKIMIVDTVLGDSGKYTCRATNIAGQADVDLILKVLIPPRIDKSNLINNPLVILGRQIFLECPVSGIPQPTIRWLRDNMPIDFNAPLNKYLLRQSNQSLGILKIELDDHGEYTCEVENKGGQATESFSIEVLVPPQMEITESPRLVRREGEPLTLICPIKDNDFEAHDSEMRITWAKNGHSLEPDNLPPNYEISKDGRRMQVLSPQISDAGQFKCVASNRAGQSHIKFDVEILSKPQIDSSRNDVEPHVIIGRPITLWCPATANPLPTIRWYRNGMLINGSDSNYRILDQGQGLELTNANNIDDAIWTCEAENPAGIAQLDIKLDVWRGPKVNVEAQEQMSIKAIDSSITLFCNISGNPPPVISWTHNGQLIIPSPDGVHISLSGSRLDIPRLSKDDSGLYECSAQNEVGIAKDDIHVDILLPPFIERDGIELNPRLPLGGTLTLFCEAAGKPIPSIIWFVNDTRISNNENNSNNYYKNIKIAEGGRFIQATNMTLQDKGIYKCQANNSAGIDELVYKVDIFQSPQIIRGGTRQVSEGQVAVLECESRGEPPPLTTWQRNGVLIETTERYVIDGTLLKIIDTRSSDSGIYVCVATNEVGTDQQAFTLEILIPPKLIQVSNNESVTVAWGDNVTLTCMARGYPTPRAYWTVDELDLERSIDQTYEESTTSIVENGFGTPRPLADALIENVEYILEAENSVLHLFNISHSKKRTFTCTVINDAGFDEINYIVKTIRPPIITKEGNKLQNVTENESLTLPCEISIDKHIKDDKERIIKWLKNGKFLDAESTAQLSKNSKELHFARIQLSDSGNYSCNSENSAGSATQYMQVNVGVPPKIVEKIARRRLLVKRGDDVELLCEAVGIPQPKIIWFKENKTLDQSNQTILLNSQRSVIFKSISADKAGIYSCKAENWAGKDTMTIDLVVLIPPEIVPARENLTTELGETIILPCNASGIPEPVVSWIKMPDTDINGQENKYQILGTSLAIKNISILDDGFYHCIAKSDAGHAIGVRKISIHVPAPENRQIWVECDENGTPIQSTYVAARGDIPDIQNYLHWETEIAELYKNGTDEFVVNCLPIHSTQKVRNNV